MGLNAVQSYPAERVLVAALLGRPASFHELGGRVTEEMFTEPGLRLVFRAFAELASRGEYFSALLMADYLGYSFLDAELWVRFRFDGTIDKEASYAALQRLAEGRSVVIPGFYGVTPDGKIRTFSRGGSDITGALAAAALNADVYENWTDVSGILMADPRIVPDPLPIERITYNELRELSFVGAQVLHEGTVFPVREKNIPLNIRNTNEPDHPGTLITESFVEAPNPERFVTGIAGKCDFSIVTVSKKGLSGAVGTLRAILEVFENNSIPVAHTPSGIDCISLAMPTEALTPNQYSLLDELRSEINEAKARILYDYLDGQEFFHNPVEHRYRSTMNVTFTSPDPDMDKKFCAEAAEAGFVNLKGHRLVGGMRASIYNAMPTEGVEKLVDFMEKFRKANA